MNQPTDHLGEGQAGPGEAMLEKAEALRHEECPHGAEFRMLIRFKPNCSVCLALAFEAALLASEAALAEGRARIFQLEEQRNHFFTSRRDLERAKLDAEFARADAEAALAERTKERDTLLIVNACLMNSAKDEGVVWRDDGPNGTQKCHNEAFEAAHAELAAVRAEATKAAREQIESVVAALPHDTGHCKILAAIRAPRQAETDPFYWRKLMDENPAGGAPSSPPPPPSAHVHSWSVSMCLCGASKLPPPSEEPRPLASWVAIFNGGVRCDMAVGPCSCGATHHVAEGRPR